jgi:hypothetical protein
MPAIHRSSFINHNKTTLPIFLIVELHEIIQHKNWFSNCFYFSINFRSKVVTLNYKSLAFHFFYQFINLLAIIEQCISFQSFCSLGVELLKLSWSNPIIYTNLWLKFMFLLLTIILLQKFLYLLYYILMKVVSLLEDMPMHLIAIFKSKIIPLSIYVSKECLTLFTVNAKSLRPTTLCDILETNISP